MSAAPKFEVERYIAPDDDGTTYWGYTMFGTAINGAVVADLNDITDFYSAGWTGSDYPNATASVQFWNEATGSIEQASTGSESLSERGCWITLIGSQTPTMLTSGALHDHKLGGAAKTFTVTRQGPNAEYAGWNMLFNPYQAKLDWDSLYNGANSNSAVIEDQFAIWDTQKKRYRRYGTSTAGVSWSNEQEAAEDSTSMRYIEPGQAFWVRVLDGVSSGTVSIDASMINNDAASVGFIRSEAEESAEVLLEVENAFGATRTLLRFAEDGSASGYVDGDMSFMYSSSVNAGEAALVVDGERYVAKHLPLEPFELDLFVESLMNWATTIRVVYVSGGAGFCAHIADNETGEVLVLEEGAEMEYTLPQTTAADGRFTLHSVPFAAAQGIAPECPDSESGMIVMELGEAVADLTVTDYNTLDIVATLYQETGTVELPIAPGEYAIMVLADEETSYCRGGRRQVVVAPGEQPELLGVEAIVSDCNEGMAALEFELYGGGTFETELMQGNASVWQGSLSPGEHMLEDIIPGEYILKVDHACLETFQFVSLLDEDAPQISLDYNGFVQADASGGAWLHADCPLCTFGDGYGYTWLLDGVEVGENGPLEVRVEEVGTYSIELVTYGFACTVSESFEMIVGKYLTSMEEGIQWIGLMDGDMGMVFAREFKNVTFRWYDASGRLLDEGLIPNGLGEVYIDAPDTRGWVSLELRNADGWVARWNGVR